MWTMVGLAPSLNPSSVGRIRHTSRKDSGRCWGGATKLGFKHKSDIPDNFDLSVSNLPIEMSRIESGLDGFASHSTRLWISIHLSNVARSHTFPPISEDQFLQFVQAHVDWVVGLNFDTPLLQILPVQFEGMPRSSGKEQCDEQHGTLAGVSFGHWNRLVCRWTNGWNSQFTGEERW